MWDDQVSEVIAVSTLLYEAATESLGQSRNHKKNLLILIKTIF
jgi:hypothetical protein